jgi:hypothetical protein
LVRAPPPALWIFLSVPAFGSRGKDVRQLQPHSRIRGLRLRCAQIATGTTRGGNCNQYSWLVAVRTELLVFR